MRKYMLAGLMILTLAGCRDHDSSGGSPASLEVELAAGAGSATVVAGNSTILATMAAVIGNVTTPVVPDLQYDKTVFSQVTFNRDPATGLYILALTVRTDAAPGEYKGIVTLRLCQESACTNVYAGSTVTYSYDVTVTAVATDWSTVQGTAAHTGYVPLTLDATTFAKAWQWTLPGGGPISAVSTGGGDVYLVAVDDNTPGKIFALNEATGAQAWLYTMTDRQSLVPGGQAYFPKSTHFQPSYGNGTVFVPASDPSINGASGYIYAIDAVTGAYKFTINPSTIGNLVDGPVTIYNGTVYYQLTGISVIGETEGKQFSAHDAGDGHKIWENFSAPGGAGDQTPAIDQDTVYFRANATSPAVVSMVYLNRADGTPQIPFSTAYKANGSVGGGGVDGAVALGPDKDAVSLNGVVINSLANAPRPVQSFDISTGALKWQSTNTYITFPALAGGRVYAGRSAQLDVLDETSGNMLWSWPVPAADAGIVGNIVVTNNLVFVSTDKHIYAIDTMSHAAVWTFNASGRLAISKDGTLLITTYTTNTAGVPELAASDGGLIAIKLK